jgi:15-cis-phytoene synthase
MSPELQKGFAQAKAVTRRHSKSFYFSSHALFGARRRAAFALYAFCRHLDDMVDGDAAMASSTQSLAQRLAQARSVVASLYQDNVKVVHGPFDAYEFAAFRDTVQRFQIPQAPFDALIDGMEMDLSVFRYDNFAQLDLYCERVAGVVGAMMTPILGYRDAAAMPYASDLGRAMQLTNILRDVAEDWTRGRVYLPQDELRHFGVSEEDLARGRVTPQFIELMRFQIARARALYQRAELGIAMLNGFGARPLVRVMSRVYGGILGAIEARRYDVFSGRAFVSTLAKVQLSVGAVLFPSRTLAALPSPQAPPSLEVG